jgi:hypothetical protein
MELKKKRSISIKHMPKHEDFTNLTERLTDPSDKSDKSDKNCKYKKRDACIPLGICGLCVCLGLLCGYLIHEGYLIEDGSI